MPATVVFASASTRINSSSQVSHSIYPGVSNANARVCVTDLRIMEPAY